MILLPAIDLKDAKCVRLTQGKFDTVNVYHDDPIEVAKMWQDQGAEYLHLVDLDGAKDQGTVNRKIIEKIIAALNIPVEIGGGVRSEERARQLIEMGAARVILGTIAVQNKELTRKIAEKHGEKIAVGVDAVGGKAAVKGWKEVTHIDVLSICKFMEDIGIRTLIYTDILRDGMLKGPNIKEYERLTKTTKLNIIASGGVTTLADIEHLDALQLYGCIIGKSLYDKRIDFKEALACLQKG